MKIMVERHIEQVNDGSQYKGSVKISGTKFDYELKFAVPIPKLDNMKPVKDKNEIRRLFQLTLKRGLRSIELTDDEYGFFFSMLVPFAAEFYNSPQTRSSNESDAMGPLLRGVGPAAAFGASASIGITSSGSWDFSPELCEMLNGPKFGCALKAA